MSDSIINGMLPPISINQPTQIDAYLVVARDLLQGVEALSIMTKLPPRSCSLIAAHALECILKAFLWHKGKRKKIRQSKIQHNLVALWGHGIQGRRSWYSTSTARLGYHISIGHGPNFYFRYQEGEEKTIVNGGQTPELIPMKIAMKDLFEIVELAIKG